MAGGGRVVDVGPAFHAHRRTYATIMMYLSIHMTFLSHNEVHENDQIWCMTEKVGITQFSPDMGFAWWVQDATCNSNAHEYPARAFRHPGQGQ